MNDGFYGEINGKLDLGSSPVASMRNAVVLSDITHGAHSGTRASGIGVKYVARGTEYYTISGRTYAVDAGQFMCVSQDLESVVEVKRTGASTLGMCMFIRQEEPKLHHEEVLEAPLVLPANCSALGTLLAGTLKEMLRPAAKRPLLAASLIREVASGLEPLLASTARELDSLASLKKSTRCENLRKLSVARGYLHAVTARPVSLPELASVAGLSQFQLLRYFKDCYGAPPGTYHRQLRLRLAKEVIDLRRLSCTEAAHRYGFADASSLSHSYRRAFGLPPVKNRSSAPAHGSNVPHPDRLA